MAKEGTKTLQRGQFDRNLLKLSVTHPKLSSTQINYTPEETLKDLEEAPKYHYTVMFSLKPRQGTNYKTASWSLPARHLMAMVQQADLK